MAVLNGHFGGRGDSGGRGSSSSGSSSIGGGRWRLPSSPKRRSLDEHSSSAIQSMSIRGHPSTDSSLTHSLTGHLHSVIMRWSTANGRLGEEEAPTTFTHTHARTHMYTHTHTHTREIKRA
eukprot:GHVU01144844.1.p1 GENE.GHVU01144844.1~~GHVU01144844.1.p1  ORF type:complete len:121 (+),score=12.09 GHVU01144844.1:1-363(+)